MQHNHRPALLNCFGVSEQKTTVADTFQPPQPPPPDPITVSLLPHHKVIRILNLMLIFLIRAPILAVLQYFGFRILLHSQNS